MTLQNSSAKRNNQLENITKQGDSLVNTIKILSDMTRKEIEKIHSP